MTFFTYRYWGLSDTCDLPILMIIVIIVDVTDITNILIVLTYQIYL